MIRKLLVSALAALGLAAIPGCGTDGPVGHVRLVNATTAYAAMDLYADGDSVLSGVASDTASAYAEVKEGSRVLDVRNGGSGTTAATTTQTISTDKHYSLVAYLSGTALTTQWLPDDDAAPSGAYADMRVLNAASAQVGDVDVYLTSSACNALGITDTPVAAAVSGLQSTYAKFTAASGTGTSYHVCVTGAGDSTDLRLDVPTVTFTAGQVTTLILTPTSGGVLLDGFLLAQQGALMALGNTSARIRVVADAASSAAVTASLNGSSLLQAGSSPQLSSYQTVTSGSATFAVTIDGVSVTVPTSTIAAGGDYTLLVAGTSAAPTVALITDDNSPSTSTSLTSKIRLVNGANGADPAGLLVNGLQVADNIAFGTASSYTQVAPSAALATITARAGATTLWTGGTQTLAAQGVYTLFLMGDLGTTQDTSLLIQDH